MSEVHLVFLQRTLKKINEKLTTQRRNGQKRHKLALHKRGSANIQR
jgi:hypothetical protein